jgi:hypothetical protein
VRPYLGERNDTELASFADYLLTLTEVANMRLIEKKNWRQKL